MAKDLGDFRKRLDDIDRRILDALSDRQNCIGEVARLKANADTRLRDILREEAQLTRLTELGRQKGLDTYYVTRLFRDILEHSVRYQQEHIADQQNPERMAVDTIRVAYQGAEGAYSHIAAMKHFGPRNIEAVYKGWDNFEVMLEAVQTGRADYAMLPIENTTAGSINEAYDLLARMTLPVVGEEVLLVDHCLVALEDTHINRVRRVYSHPQALAQCSAFLSNLHHCTVESFPDTAMAVEKIRNEKDVSQAAIASEDAAKLYGLTVIKRGIANQKDNYTRFVVVAHQAAQYDERIPCKTSLIFATRHEQGALLKCLNVLAGYGLNLTKLESRPRPNVPWEYLFYLDFEGNAARPEVKTALGELATHTSFLKVLGSYPARTTSDSRPAEPRRTAVKPSATEADVTSASPPEGGDAVRQMVEGKPYRLVSRAQRLEDTCINVGAVVIGGKRPVVIAGPTAVESAEQIAQCARAAKNLGADVLYGGCFLPRSVTEGFEGLGLSGLEMLERAGRSVGLPVATEVLDPGDVSNVARHADLLVIGGRNMQNTPLLREVGSVDRPVILGRGLMASVDDWLAAAEQILVTGNQQVILCERGIRTFETATRSTLDLAAVPVVKQLAHLPVIVFPSKASGNWRLVAPMAEASLAAGAHGLMIEIHPNPEQALSGGEQALSFDTFQSLMQQLSDRLE